MRWASLGNTNITWYPIHARLKENEWYKCKVDGLFGVGNQQKRDGERKGWSECEYDQSTSYACMKTE
jgi:hypothetical protein